VIHRASRIVFPFLFLAVSAVGANPTVDVPTMKTIVEDAIHPDLYWQDFSDLEEQTMTFYTAREWKPAWMRDGRVTSQARQIAAFMATVDDRGLHAADYDAQAWPGLMNAIDRGSLGDPTALARFDVGFTVSTMRCVSDLDLGRVNPKEFTFRVDVDEKRHDLPRYIALLTTDDDLDSTLAEIEPEVAVYERTRQALVRYRRHGGSGSSPRCGGRPRGRSDPGGLRAGLRIRASRGRETLPVQTRPRPGWGDGARDLY
jgi:murein L,D-transpeptidase YcbB/YkuD